MAKIDFCFTYYDGDAARDKAHLTRLERGAYDDLISAIRKRGHLSLDDIKKVLSKDFESCWPALEWILLTDEEGRFFIEWLENSLFNMKRHSKKQSANIGSKYQTGTKRVPNDSDSIPNITKKVPLGNGNGNEEEKKEGVGERKTENVVLPEITFPPPDKPKNPEQGTERGKWKTNPTEEDVGLELQEFEMNTTIEYIDRLRQTVLTKKRLKDFWQAFKIQQFTGAKFYHDRSRCIDHFRNWLKGQNFEDTKANVVEMGGLETLPKRYKRL